MSSKPVIQTHHLVYENLAHKQKEIKVKIYKGEHLLLTNLGWRNKISKGFIKALKQWIVLNEDKGVDLDGA